LAPRINAAGRMGHARQAVEMLTTANKDRADEIAQEMDKQNRDRQELERKIYKEAIEQATQLGMDKENVRGVVLGLKNWHPGVIGIVASRVVGKLNKPTIMISLDDEEGHGSGRSISGFHLARALDACSGTLISCGGHEMAAGLRLKTGNFDEFRQKFNEYALANISDDMMVPQLNMDCLAPLDLIDMPLVEDLKRLGPFGTANHKPLICCNDVELVADPTRVGKTMDHVQLMIRQNGIVMKCIAFNQGDLANQIKKGDHIDLAVEPSINEYNGYRNVELQVVDARMR
jgi:single-stranded-DNA-specific exonuclease